MITQADLYRLKMKKAAVAGAELTGGVPPGGDPAAMGGAPMDPAAAGGMPPGDPAAAGMPPGDPAAMGGMPMDPAAMGGGMPPQAAPPAAAPAPAPAPAPADPNQLLGEIKTMLSDLSANAGGEKGKGAKKVDVNAEIARIGKAVTFMTKLMSQIAGQLGITIPPADVADMLAPPPEADGGGQSGGGGGGESAKSAFVRQQGIEQAAAASAFRVSDFDDLAALVVAYKDRR